MNIELYLESDELQAEIDEDLYERDLIPWSGVMARIARTPDDEQLTFRPKAGIKCPFIYINGTEPSFRRPLVRLRTVVWPGKRREPIDTR